MPYALEFSGAGARLYSSTANASVSSEVAVVAGKIRFRGDMVTDAATEWSGNGPRILTIGSTAGGQEKLYLSIEDWSTGNIRFFLEGKTGGSQVIAGNLTVARSNFSASAWYVLYFQLAKASSPGSLVAVYDDAGTLIGTASGDFSGGDIDAGGYIGSGVANPNGNTGAVDGLAIYNAVLAGAARYSVPTAADANLLQLTYFDDGTGTDAVSVVGVDLDTHAGTLAWSDNSADANRWSAAGGSDTPPTADFTIASIEPSTETNGCIVTVASTATAGTNPITSDLFDWGDGSEPDAGPTHEYGVDAGGQYTITQTVSDGTLSNEAAEQVITREGWEYRIDAHGMQAAYSTGFRFDA